MALHEDSGRQEHHCSCDVDSTIHQSSLEPADELDAYDTGVGISPHRNNFVSASTAPFNQTSASEQFEPPLTIRAVLQGCSHSFEFLKHALSSKNRRKILYALPAEAAIAAIDGLERGSRESSGLCPYHRERFSLVLRKMCREHKLLPSSCAIADGLQTIGEIPYGRGGNADVWRGLYRGSNVAIKMLRIHSKMDLTSVEMNFCREVVLWKQFRHPNLLPLVGATKSLHTLTMVSDWMEHGTITDFITACPETNRLKLLADVARGLKYLHDWPSVHADLKSSNILIDSNRTARIADFGLTSILHNPSVSISVTAPVWGGTPRWMAPELFDGMSSPSKESDIYALGMVIYEVFAQERPFSQVSPILVPLLVLDGKRPPRPQNREILGLSEDVWMVAERCWDGSPDVRPHIADILSLLETTSHHWVSSTSGAIASLGLSRPTAQKPPTKEPTLTMSEGV